ncbi:MAG: D-2-hydroxyacid dehydrogenase [Kiritimatiellia bacterium]
MGSSARIVVLDGYTLNPGDLSWAPLEALGPCTIYDWTPAEKTFDRAKDAAIVLTNKTILDAETIAGLPLLRYIGVLATGYNVVDIEAARQRGIPVANVPDYATPSVVQTVFAHLLEHTHHVAQHSDGIRAGKWSRSRDFCYWERPLLELAGLTMGILGVGRIGQAVARVARAFRMNVIACDPFVRSQPSGLTEVEMVDLESLFRKSDVLTLHCVLSEQTRRIVNAERLALMRPTAILINTGRGALVDEIALAEALNAGRIAGAGLDVLSVEPPPPDNPLLSARNCTITPHIAWATRAARQRLLQVAVANVAAFLEGKPINVVNP